jgi:hypothetical protein
VAIVIGEADCSARFVAAAGTASPILDASEIFARPLALDVAQGAFLLQHHPLLVSRIYSRFAAAASSAAFETGLAQKVPVFFQGDFPLWPSRPLLLQITSGQPSTFRCKMIS